MFRGTSAGLALQEAIASLKGTPSELTPGQEGAVWEAFEDSMLEVLEDVPQTHAASITMKDDAASAAAGLPAYRAVDGRWTVALGASTVQVAIPNVSETFDTDFVLVDAMQRRRGGT